MMSLTHIAIAMAGAAAIPGNDSPICFLLAGVGSLIPDIDTTKSLPGKILFPVAHWLEEHGEHRGVTHSYLFTIILIVALFPLLSLYDWHHWISIPLGHFLSCRADCFTKSGVRLFWPHRGLCVAGLNPNFRLSTGSSAEIPIIAVALGVAYLMLNINTSGGMSQLFAQNFMQNKDTAVQMFQKHGTRQAIEVDIIGRSTQGEVKQRYQVIDVISGDLIVADSAGTPYRVGFSEECQIKPTSIKAKVSSPVAIKTFEQKILEADSDQWIASLSPAAYLIGSLSIDDGAELRQPQQLNSMPVITVGAETTLNYARVKDLAPISQSWITSGNVIIKEIVNGTP